MKQAFEWQPGPAPEGMGWFAEQGWDRHAAAWRTYYRLRPARKRALRYTDPYVRVFKEGWTRLRRSALTASEARLFFAVMELASQETEWNVSPVALRALLQWDAARISKTLTSLVTKGLIVRTRPATVAHDPLVSWSADVQTRETAKHMIRHPEFYDLSPESPKNREAPPLGEES